MYKPNAGLVGAAGLILAWMSAASLGGGAGETPGVFRIRSQADFDTYRAATFSAGDRILFAQGRIFNGAFTPTGSGRAGAPIVVAAYDPATGEVFEDDIENKPVINGNGAVNAAFYLENGEYWEISNLELTNTDGSRRDQGPLRGIHVVGRDAGILNHIVIRHCYVHSVNGEVGGKEHGGIHIHVLGDETRTRFDGVLIENNVIRNVGGVGIGNQSTWRGLTSDDYYPWRDLVIRGNRVERTGRNGIIVRMAIAPLVEHNVLAFNSRFSTGHSVFNFNTIDCVMQFNEAYGNTGNLRNDRDRGGFDADWSARGTVIQYNYSHDNHWFAGIMRRAVNEDVVIRYNISQNERLGAYFYGFPRDAGVRNVQVYNNTHFFRAGLNAAIFANPRPHNRTPIETAFWNNIFVFEDAGAWGIEPDPETTEFSHNLFFNVEPRGRHSVTGDPRLVAPGTGGRDIDMRDPDRLAGYRLRPDSPAIGAGREVPDHGGRDFWGNPLYHGAPDIGAHELLPRGREEAAAASGGAMPAALPRMPGAAPGTAEGEEVTVASIDGTAVSAAELRHWMLRERAAVARHFFFAHGVTDAADLWREEFGGESPARMLRERALEAIVRIKVQQRLANEKGVSVATDFLEIMEERAAVNRARRERIERGGVVYGPPAFTPRGYIDQVLDRMAGDLKARLAETAFKLGDRELRARFRAQGLEEDRHFAQVRGALQMQAVDEAYARWIEQRAATAEVRVERAAFDRVSVW